MGRSWIVEVERTGKLERFGSASEEENARDAVAAARMYAKGYNCGVVVYEAEAQLLFSYDIKRMEAVCSLPNSTTTEDLRAIHLTHRKEDNEQW